MQQKFMNNNKNQITYFLNLTLFLFILGAICALILSIVNFFTKSVIEDNKNKELRETLESVGLYDYQIITDDYDLVDNVIEIYSGYSQRGKSLIAILVEKSNRYVSIESLIIIDQEEEKIENIKIVGSATSHNMDNQFNSDFGVIGSNRDNYREHFQIIAGATVSSNTINDSIKTAFDQLNIIKGVITDEYLPILSDLGLQNIVLVSNDNLYIDGCLAIYQGEFQAEKVVLAFVTVSSNDYLTLKTITIIDKQEEKIEKVKVITRATSYNEALGYEEKFNSDFGVTGCNQDNYEAYFKIVTGATTSSKNVKECLNIAFKQLVTMRGINND